MSATTDTQVNTHNDDVGLHHRPMKRNYAKQQLKVYQTTKNMMVMLNKSSSLLSV